MATNISLPARVYRICARIHSLKAQGLPLSLSDFAPFDVLRPGKNAGLIEFLDTLPSKSGLNILGCKIGGTNRYLAS